MNTVMLKNGAEEVEQLVTVVAMSIDDLLKTSPITLFELVAKCKDANHKIFGNHEKRLEDRALIENGVIPASIRHIVLSGVVGEGLDMQFVSPIALKKKGK